MKNFRIMALILALVMVVSLVACGGTTDETGAPDVKKETEAPAVNETEAPAKETEAPAVKETEAPAVETEAPVDEDAIILDAFDGAYVRGGENAGTAFYNESANAPEGALEIKGNREGGFDPTVNYDRAAFLKFDLSELGGNAVESATLNVNFKEAGPGRDGRTYVITIVGAEWIGMDLTTSTMPEKTGGSVSGAFAEGAEQTDITALVNEAIANGAEVLAIMIESPKEMMGENGSQTMIIFNDDVKPFLSCK